MTDGKIEKLDKPYRQGTKHKCRIIDFDPLNGIYQVSMQPSVLNQPFLTCEAVKVGAVHKGKIIRIEKYGILVSLSSHVKALCHSSHLTEVPLANAQSKFLVGQTVKFRVLNVRPKEKKIHVTMKKTLVKSELPIITNYKDAKVGLVTVGFVESILDKVGCIVQFFGGVKGFLPIEEVKQTDDGKKDFTLGEMVFVGQVVECRVVSCRPEENKLKVSLRLTPTKKEKPQQASEKEVQKQATEKKLKTVEKKSAEKKNEEIKVGDIAEGFVINVTKHGCFVKLKNKQVARVKIAEMSKKYVKNWQSLVAVGQAVKGIITNVEDKKIELSFKKLQLLEDEEKNELEEDVEGGAHESDEEVEEVEQSDESEDEGVKLSAGFEFQNNDDKEKEEEEDSDKEVIINKKKKKQTPEEAMLLDEISDIPETQNDFERLLMGSPNDGSLWVRFMAYHLKLGEIDKARKVAEKALSTIAHRLENEKFRVWTAYLNLENTFGSESTLKTIFEKAVNYNEPKRVYLQMSKIYEKSGKLQDAEEMHQKTLKKFGKSSKAWTLFAQFYFVNNGNGNITTEKGRKLLNQSLLSLPKRKHIKTLIKFAQLEFRNGEAERGRTIFEGVLTNYPKRVDLWSVYLDMEEKMGNKENIR